MKMKKIFAACAASVTALSMMAFSASAQGADDDSTVIDDTPVVTEATEVITEAPVVTEAPAPVAPVTNPTTGNAPVALAVIPVALAAAAVVAKKANK